MFQRIILAGSLSETGVRHFVRICILVLSQKRNPLARIAFLCIKKNIFFPSIKSTGVLNAELIVRVAISSFFVLIVETRDKVVSNFRLVS